MLVAGKIKFEPDLPKRHLDAVAKLRLGSHDHVALELTGNPLGLRADELVFEKSESRQTAAIFANVSGTTICVVDVGGSFGRDLSAKGEAAMVDFAIGWLGGLYGADVKNAVKRRHATRWNNEPWVLGAISAAAPGAQSARKVMMEPLSNRIFFAGEAVARDALGHRRRRLGIGRARRRCRDQAPRPALAHVPEKWEPVFRTEHAQNRRI